MSRRALPVVVLGLALVLVVIAFFTPRHAGEIVTGPTPTPPPVFLSPRYVAATIGEAARAHGVDPPLMIAVAACESGLVWNARGDWGHSKGVWQINDYGLLRTFYAQGWTDPDNVWMSSMFAASEFSRGGAGAWSCYWVVKGLPVPWWR